MKYLKSLLVSALLIGPAFAQTTQPAQPVRADAVASPEEVAALRQELAEAKSQLQDAKKEATQPVRAETVSTPAAAPIVINVEPVEAATVAPQRPTPSADGRVSVPEVVIRSTRSSGKQGIDVTASVSLIDVPSISFRFEAALVTPDGQVHTDPRGNPYISSREIHTGDAEDKDDYSVFIDLTNLFSSRPPADLYVQVRIVDPTTDKIVATSGMYNFRRPWL